MHYHTLYVLQAVVKNMKSYYIFCSKLDLNHNYIILLYLLCGIYGNFIKQDNHALHILCLLDIHLMKWFASQTTIFSTKTLLKFIIIPAGVYTCIWLDFVITIETYIGMFTFGYTGRPGYYTTPGRRS